MSSQRRLTPGYWFHLGHQVDVRGRCQGGVLVLTGCVERGVDARGRDEEAVAGGELRDGVAGVGRMGCQVDDGVPGLSGDRGEGVGIVPIGADEGDTGRGGGRPAGEARDGVAVVERGAGECPAEEAGAAEEEDVHVLSVSGGRVDVGRICCERRQAAIATTAGPRRAVPSSTDAARRAISWTGVSRASETA